MKVVQRCNGSSVRIRLNETDYHARVPELSQLKTHLAVQILGRIQKS